MFARELTHPSTSPRVPGRCICPALPVLSRPAPRDPEIHPVHGGIPHQAHIQGGEGPVCGERHAVFPPKTETKDLD